MPKTIQIRGRQHGRSEATRQAIEDLVRKSFDELVEASGLVAEYKLWVVELNTPGSYRFFVAPALVADDVWGIAWDMVPCPLGHEVCDCVVVVSDK